jgi:hypothetical protein
MLAYGPAKTLPQRRADETTVASEPGADDLERRDRRIGERRLHDCSDARPEGRLVAETAPDHEHERIECVHEHRKHPAQCARCLVQPGSARERRPTRDPLDRRRPEHDRTAARAGVRSTVHHEAEARARADDGVEER